MKQSILVTVFALGLTVAFIFSIELLAQPQWVSTLP